LTVAEVPAWKRLLSAVEKSDGTGGHVTEADLADELSGPDVDPDQDVVGAFDGHELVGYYSVCARVAADGSAKFQLNGAVLPTRRRQGIGTELVRRMVARAVQVHAEKHPTKPARLLLPGQASNSAQAALLADAGLVPQRWLLIMRASLANLEPYRSPLPTGFRLGPYDHSYDTEMRTTHNETFHDHPDFTPWDEAGWRHSVTGHRSFRPHLSFLVVEERRPGRIAAYVHTCEFDAHHQATGRREGYIARIGTRLEHRGRGLAGALLQHCLAAYRDAGLDDAALDVDADNPTGALGLYQRAGFRVERRFAHYVLDRPPVHA
jgi:mycothiol synthase